MGDGVEFYRWDNALAHALYMYAHHGMKHKVYRTGHGAWRVTRYVRPRNFDAVTLANRT